MNNNSYWNDAIEELCNELYEDDSDFLTVMGYNKTKQSIDYESIIMYDDNTDVIAFTRDNDTHENYVNLLKEAVKNNKQKIVNYLLNSYQYEEDDLLIVARMTIKDNNLNLLKKLLNDNKKDNSLLLCDAVSQRKRNIVYYLCDNGYSHPGAILDAIDNKDIFFTEYFLKKIKKNNKYNPLLFDSVYFHYKVPGDNIFPYIKYCVLNENYTMFNYFVKKEYSIYYFKAWVSECGSYAKNILLEYASKIRGINDSELTKAIKENNMLKIDYLTSIGAKTNNEIDDYVIKNGLIEIIKMLVTVSSHGYDLFDKALEYNQINIAQYYVDYYYLMEGHTSLTRILLNIIRTNNIQKLKNFMIIFNNLNFYEKILCDAFSCEQYEIFNYLLEMGVSKSYFEKQYLEKLCVDRKIRTIQKFINMNFNYDWCLDRLFRVGLECNNLDLVKLIINDGIVIDKFENVLRWPCHNNNIEMVKYLVEHGCAIDNFTYNNPLFLATTNGYLEIVKILVNNGAIIDSNFIVAVQGQKRDIIDFFLENGTDIMMNSCVALIEAFKSYNLDFVKYIVSKMDNRTIFCDVYFDNIVELFRLGTFEIINYMYTIYKSQIDRYVMDTQLHKLIKHAFKGYNLNAIKFLNNVNNQLISYHSKRINKVIREYKIPYNNKVYDILKYSVENGLIIFEYLVPLLHKNYSIYVMDNFKIDPKIMLKYYNFEGTENDEIRHFIELNVCSSYIIPKTLKAFSIPVLWYFVTDIEEMEPNSIVIKFLYDYVFSMNNGSFSDHIKQYCVKNNISLDDNSYNLSELLNICFEMNSFELFKIYYDKCVTSHNLINLYETLINSEDDYSIIYKFLKTQYYEIYKSLKKHIFLTTILEKTNDIPMKNIT